MNSKIHKKHIRQVLGIFGQSEIVSLPLAFINGGSVLYFSSAWSKANYQEVEQDSATETFGVPLNLSEVDTDSVGTIYDLSDNASLAAGIDQSNAIALNSDVNRNTFYETSAKTIAVRNSRGLLKPIWSPTADGIRKACIAFHIKKATDGTLQYFLSNPTNTANSGIIIWLSTENKVGIAIYRSASGQTTLNYTSTASITVASGWTSVIVNINGNAGELFIGDETPEALVLNSAGSTDDANNALYIGSLNGGASNRFNGAWDDFLILNREMTSEERIDFKVYNPIRNTQEFNTLSRDYDFNDASVIYSDDAKTTTVTNGSDVAVVSSKKVYNFGGSDAYDLTQTNGVVRPVFTDNLINSLSGVVYTTGDTLALSRTLRGGAFTLFIVAKNTDATFGSHLLTGRADVYVVLTGSNYSGAYDDPYLVAHHDTGGDSIGIQTGDTTDTYQVLAVRRNGTVTTIFNGLGEKETSGSISKNFSFNRLGTDAFSSGTDWDFTGEYLRFKEYYGYMTDAQIIAEINALKTIYAIT